MNSNAAMAANWYTLGPGAPVPDPLFDLLSPSTKLEKRVPCTHLPACFNLLSVLMDDHQSQDSDEELNAQGHRASVNASLYQLNGVISTAHDKPHLIGDREGRIRCILGSACTNPQGNRGHKISAYVTWHSGNVCRDCSAHFCCKGCNRKHRLPSGKCNITLFKGRLYPYTLWEAAVAHRQGVVGQKRGRSSEDCTDPAPAASAAKAAYTVASQASQERRLSQQLGSNWLTGLQEASAWQSISQQAKDEPDYTQEQDQQVHWLQQLLHPQLHRQLQAHQQQLPQQHHTRQNASSSSSQLPEQPQFQDQQQHDTAAAAAAPAEGGMPTDVAALRLQLAAAAAAAAAAQCGVTKTAVQQATQEMPSTLGAAVRTAAAAVATQTLQSRQIEQLQLQLEDAMQENAMLRQQVSELRAVQQREGHEFTAVSGAGGGTANLRLELLAARQEAAAYKQQAAGLRQVLATARQFSGIMLPMFTSILEAQNLQQLLQNQQCDSVGDLQQSGQAVGAAAAPARQQQQQQQRQREVAPMQPTEPQPLAGTDAVDVAEGHMQNLLRLLTCAAADRGKSLGSPAAAAAAALTTEELSNRSGQLQQDIANILLCASSTNAFAATNAARLRSSSAQQDLSAALLQVPAAAAGRGASPVDPAAAACATAAVQTAALVLPQSLAAAQPSPAATEDISVAVGSTAAQIAQPEQVPAQPEQVPAQPEQVPADDDAPEGVPGVRYSQHADAPRASQPQHRQQQLGLGGGVDPAAVAADLLVSLSRLHSVNPAI